VEHKAAQLLFSMKEIYKDLYTTDNQRETAFILKDPSQVNSQAERLF
jgi:hypothetical protein